MDVFLGHEFPISYDARRLQLNQQMWEWPFGNETDCTVIMLWSSLFRWRIINQVIMSVNIQIQASENDSNELRWERTTDNCLNVL